MGRWTRVAVIIAITLLALLVVWLVLGAFATVETGGPTVEMEATPEASPTPAPSPRPTPPTLTAAEAVTLVVTALEKGEFRNGMLTFPYAGLWVVHASSCTARWEKGHWWVDCGEAQISCPAGEVCPWVEVNVCLWEDPLEIDTCL